MKKLNEEVTIAIFNAESVDRDLERLRRRAVLLWEKVLEAEQALVENLPEGATLELEIAKRGVESARLRLKELRWDDRG